MSRRMSKKPFLHCPTGQLVYSAAREGTLPKTHSHLQEGIGIFVDCRKPLSTQPFA